VFAITTTSSVFAYIWLYIVLGLNSKDEVTFSEAIITFIFFFILVILAFIADKYNERKKARIAKLEGKTDPRQLFTVDDFL
jgi:solute carrier family 8 (sodium/calcium exchanger)